MIKTILAIAVCFMGAVCQFYPGRNISVPVGVVQLDYSPDQKLLAAASKDKLFIFDSRTGEKLTQKLFNASYIVVTFAFNRNSTLLAIGFNNGEARLYSREGNDFTDLNKTYKYPGTSNIESLCFNSDGSALVIGVKQNFIVHWTLADNKQATTNFMGSFITTVSCSPIDLNLFVVGGSELANNKFTFYKFNGTDIVQEHDTQPKSNSKVEGSDFSGDGAYAYRAGMDGIIYRYNINDNYVQQNLTLTELQGKNLTKLRVSSNGRLLATVYSGFAVIIKQTAAIGQYFSLQGIEVEQFPTTAETVALSSKGGHLFFVSQDGQGSVLEECKKGQYAAQDGTCLNCSSNCLQCEDETTCYECNARYFIKTGVCAKCSSGCLNCVDELTCNQCDTAGHFNKTVDNVCVCQNRYFFQDESCLACSTGCLTCVSQSDCTQCKPEFNLVDKFCICKPATFPVGDTCQNCERGCLACLDAITCQKCILDEHYILDANGSCVCDSSAKFIDDGVKCICQPGFYDQTGVCLNCPLGCETCTSSSQCQTCKPGLATKGGVCQCIEPQSYIDVNATCQYCNLTLKQCANCTSATNCVECHQGTDRVVVGGKCVCRKGFFQDDNQKCQLCIINGCQECKNATYCNICNQVESWQFDVLTGQCKCAFGHVQIEHICVKCPIGCKTCDANATCLECDTQNHWIADQNNDCKCIKSYFQQNDKCIQCMPGCLDCVQLAKCLECSSAAQFDIVDGVCLCKYGFYIRDRDCLTCGVIPHCLDCQDEKHCRKCSEPFHVNSTNVCGCAQGQYATDSNCVDCAEGCKTCDHEDICTSCQDGYDLEDDKCKKNGINTLVIVLIVVGVIVLAGAIFVIIKCIKKRRTPLSQDDYEEL